MNTSLQNISTIFFDFDGTIADTLELGVAVSNSIAEKYGYKKISDKQELELYRNLSTQKAIKTIGISYLKLPIVANAFRKELAKQVHKLKPIDGIKEVIKELSKSYKLGIVTSNSQENIENFLDRYEIKECFQYISTGIRLFQKNKTLKSILTTTDLEPNQVLLVGDETRDIEAAEKCGLTVISVSWGFHTRAVLEKFNPDYLIDHPNQLLDLLATSEH